NGRRQGQSAHRVSGFLRRLERRRRGRSHPETSQDRVRKTAIEPTFDSLEIRTHGGKKAERRRCHLPATFCAFRCRTQPSFVAWRARPRARASAGTSSVMVEPAPTYAFLPMRTGATRVESLPMNAPSSITVTCFFSPS